MANNEDNKVNYFFILPFIFLLIGFYLLVGLGAKNDERDGRAAVETDSSATSKNPVSIGVNRVDTILVSCCYPVTKEPANATTEPEIAETDGSTDQAYPYFLLASIISLVLLVLPRLKSLTISKDSVSIELLKEVQKDLEEVQSVAANIQRSIAAGARADETNLTVKFSEIQTKIEVVRKMLRKRNS